MLAGKEWIMLRYLLYQWKIKLLQRQRQPQHKSKPLKSPIKIELPKEGEEEGEGEEELIANLITSVFYQTKTIRWPIIHLESKLQIRDKKID